MIDQDVLGQALYDVLYVLHRTYGTTKGPFEGSVVNEETDFCFVNRPHTSEDFEILERVEGVARDWMNDKRARDDGGVHLRGKPDGPAGARYENLEEG
jgi:hypothetical protein